MPSTDKFIELSNLISLYVKALQIQDRVWWSVWRNKILRKLMEVV
jgi:hypothetical protein